MRLLSLFAFLFIFSLSTFAQKGKIEGKVTDAKSGNKITGATITVDSNKTTIATNVDGRFVVSLEAGKKHTIHVSYVGYTTKELTDIEVVPNQVTNLEIVLEQSAKTGNEIVVKSSARKETAAALLTYQKNTNTVAQVISAETIKRSPDKNTGEVLRRIPGMSMMEGKYLVVRGLADRYNQAMLNGVLLSSTEPDRKTFSFDIFPAQLVENIIVNKAFVPELPGEWAGGLIQINTKDVPSKTFLNVQIGTGFNTQTIGNDFYTYKGGSLDFLGFDDGTRALPDNFPTKNQFNQLTVAEKTEWGKRFENIWASEKADNNFFPALNKSFQLNGGFNKTLKGNNKLGAVYAINYSNTKKRTDIHNTFNSYQDDQPSLLFDYNNKRYANEVLWGALGNITLQLGANTKIAWKNLFNVNSVDYVTVREGDDHETANQYYDYTKIKANELALKTNTFFNTQLSGDHNLTKYQTKLHWYGSFAILDQYIPDQRRIQYDNEELNFPDDAYRFSANSSAGSQRSGSRYYGFLSDYIYTAGGDLSKSIKVKSLLQTVKLGYLFQVKDRIFDSRPFSIYLPIGNEDLTKLAPGEIFAPENYGNGDDNKFAFAELSGEAYRYVANNILNAAFLQFDNQITEKLRVVWGVRWESYDQLIGGTVNENGDIVQKPNDNTFVHSKVDDFLPGINLTYKLNMQTNLRLSGSQTVVRPEIRELSKFQFYDFDLGATVAGNPNLLRTKITNLDLRYEVYPKSGEVFTIGAFYKYFENPIEAYYNPAAGNASSFNYINVTKANAYGGEIEIRKKLDFSNALKNFTFQTNLSYIYNRVKDETATDVDRPMQGQSPYLINVALQYDVEKLGLTTTLLYNQIGDRIMYVGGSGVPPISEKSRPLLDFQVTKKVIKKRAELKLNVSDLLNQKAIFYYDQALNQKFDGNDVKAIERRYGTNINISFSYTIK